VLGLTNVDLQLVDAATAIDDIAARHPAGSVDVVLLYAVLEHQTLEERLECIDMSWKLLRDGGVLVVVESPNRLALWDYHTSLLPFFHQLPDDLALRYLDRSPRDAFTSSMRQALAESDDSGMLALARWGRGVGSHEFELVLGELDELIVADGYEDEIVAWFPVETEDRLLDAFFAAKDITTPRAFTRHVLNFILRKGGRRASDPLLLHEPGSSVLDAGDPSYAALEARCRAVEERYAALEASPAVRLARLLDRTPRLRHAAGVTYRAVSGLRRPRR
jgi:S-adenosylmethionine-dependent methyltransferase